MVNYYEELNLDRSKSLFEIKTELTKQEGVWKRREINNPEKATKMLAMIIEAKKVFSSETARSKYDNDLEKSARDDSPLSAEEQREISLKKWVGQARMHFGDGSSDLAKAAIEKALDYIDNDNEDIEIYTLASDIYRECKEYNMAMNYINKAIILVPKDASPMLLYSFGGLNIVGGFFLLFIFFGFVVFLNYTDVVYMGGTTIALVGSIVGGLTLMIQVIAMAQGGFGSFVFALIILIGCVIISRKVADFNDPMSKDLYREENVSHTPSEQPSNLVLPSGAWRCSGCGETNPSSSLTCKGCGRYK